MDDATIRQIEFELEKAERGMAMPVRRRARRAVAQDVGRGAQAEALGRAGEARSRQARPNLLMSPALPRISASARARERLGGKYR